MAEMSEREERAFRVFLTAVFVLPFAGIPAAIFQNWFGFALSFLLVVVAGAIAIGPTVWLVLSPIWAPVLWVWRYLFRP